MGDDSIKLVTLGRKPGVKSIKVCEIPKDFVMVKGHGTQVVVVDKLKTAEEDRLLKKAIKEDYKHVFRDVVVVRADQIDKKDFSNNFRGKNISGVELRTYIPEEKYSILRSATAPAMAFSKDSYLKHNVYEKVKTNETDKNH